MFIAPLLLAAFLSVVFLTCLLFATVVGSDEASLLPGVPALLPAPLMAFLDAGQPDLEETAGDIFEEAVDDAGDRNFPAAFGTQLA